MRSKERRLEYAEKCYRSIVRDIRAWPEWKIRKGSLMNISTIDDIIRQRNEWLDTPDGKRMIELCKEMDFLIDKA